MISSIRRQAISFPARSSRIRIAPIRRRKRRSFQRRRATCPRRPGAGCPVQRGAGNLMIFKSPVTVTAGPGACPAKGPVDLSGPERPPGPGAKGAPPCGCRRGAPAARKACSTRQPALPCAALHPSDISSDTEWMTSMGPEPRTPEPFCRTQPSGQREISSRDAWRRICGQPSAFQHRLSDPKSPPSPHRRVHGHCG